MAKYRKKPVVIDAELNTGEDDLVQAGHVAAFLQMGGANFQVVDHTGAIDINTLEGTMRADKGDYIIKGIKGEFYPCKPDIFEASYEPEGD